MDNYEKNFDKVAEKAATSLWSAPGDAANI